MQRYLTWYADYLTACSERIGLSEIMVVALEDGEVPWRLDNNGDVHLSLYTMMRDVYRFSDSDFANLFAHRCPLPRLQTIILDGSPIGDLSIAAIADAASRGHLPSLRKLSFPFTHATNDGLLALSEAIKIGGLKSLESLTFGWPRPLNEESLNVSDLRRMMALKLMFQVRTWPASMDEGLVALASAACGGGEALLPNLSELRLQSDFSDAGFLAIHKAIVRGGMPKLRKLGFHLDLLNVSPAALAPLMTPIQCADGRIVEGLEVELPICTDIALDRLLAFASAGCPINTTTLSCAGDFEFFRWMDLLGAAIETGAVPNLALLALNNPSINDDAIKPIAESISEGCLPRLKMITLGRSRILEEGVSRLLDALSKGGCKSFEVLTLDDTSIGDACLRSMVDHSASEVVDGLKCLSFGGTQITDDGIDHLVKAGRNGRLGKLMLLDLSRTKVGDDGVRMLALANSEGAFPSLTDLFLSQSAVTLVPDELMEGYDAKRICDAIRHAPVDRTRLSRGSDERLLKWFSAIPMKTWLEPLQVFWCVGTVDRDALMTSARAMGYAKLSRLLRQRIKDPKLSTLSFGQSSLVKYFGELASLFNALPFPSDAWDGDESNPDFRELSDYGSRKGAVWTPRARKAWLYVDRYLSLKKLIPSTQDKEAGKE